MATNVYNAELRLVDANSNVNVIHPFTKASNIKVTPGADTAALQYMGAQCTGQELVNALSPYAFNADTTVATLNSNFNDLKPDLNNIFNMPLFFQSNISISSVSITAGGYISLTINNVRPLNGSLKYVAMGKGSSSKQTNTVYYTENGGSTTKYPSFTTTLASIFYSHPQYDRFVGTWTISGTGSSSIVLYQTHFLDDGFMFLLKNAASSAATVNIGICTWAFNSEFGLQVTR